MGQLMMSLFISHVMKGGVSIRIVSDLNFIGNNTCGKKEEEKIGIMKYGIALAVSSSTYFFSLLLQ